MAEERLTTMAAQLAEMKEEMKKLRRNNVEEKDDMEEDNDAWVEEQPGAGWQEFLQAPKLPATAPAAKLLSTLFTCAPSFDLVKNTESEGKKYQQVPETPAPRRFGPDRQWFNVQKKLEDSMHSMVHMLETDDKEQIKICAALIRSAWEDCNHNRRCLLAGKERVKLDKRIDDNRPMLLSKEEEGKIARGTGFRQPRQLFPQQGYNQGHNQPYRARSNSQHRGKGKGKGKGKGQK